MMPQRNVILITLDSLRADHCSFMGYNRKTTPNLDKMAKNGLYFQNAVAASLPTPTSMFSVFTADYYLDLGEPLHRGLKRQFLGKKTIAQILQKKGYITIAFNKNPYIPPQNGYGRGFDIFIQYSESTMHRLLYRVFKIKRDLADLILGTGISSSWEKEWKNIIKTLKDINRPYFLWILLLDTHLPYIPSKRKWSAFFSNYLINYKMHKNRWRAQLNSNDQQKLINAYDDCILSADEFIGRLMEETEADDPILIVHADHGDGFGEHGFYHHPPILYEELIHVPLVIYNADIKGKVEDPVSLLGLSPSILELIGVNNQFPSESFLNGGKEWVISKVFDKGKRKIAVRMKEWKYIEGQKEKGELYNLRKDPTEQENLVNDYPDLVKEFRNIIRNHTKEEKRIRIRYHLRSILSD